MFGRMPALLCARRRTFLTGESPESARWWEGYSRRQGVHREVESEGSRMWEQTNHGQISGLTNRNHIEGLV